MKSIVKKIILTIGIGFIVLLLTGLAILTKNVFENQCSMSDINLIISQISLISFWALTVSFILYVLINLLSNF